ncbi:thiamine pyrophosphate-dependent enzyme [Oscillibacter sp. GMB15532]|uniref:thiamine pyrophosphate-dependent enzyme n=1 Tax=Oscillibacter sp. GMB15532 TaxID=3230022 RepID=UPI0034DF6403
MANYKDYMLFDKLPHTWCGGCGHGIILQAIASALAQQELDKHEIALVSGIGCFGRVDDYLNINCMHVTHGRALAAATGVALANPNLHVLVTMGDGDGSTIGGNHLIHCARRNINLTAIIANNYNYGQTGGQYSATTPRGSITATSVYGHVEPGFDICKLVEAAGAPFVARSTAYNPMQIRSLIKQGMQTKGFALIEIMDTCPTHYGRLNKMGNSAQMLEAVNDMTVPVEKAASMTPKELEGKFLTGVLVNKPREDYYTRYQQIIDRLVKQA